jgi:hypothetical protein
MDSIRELKYQSLRKETDSLAKLKRRPLHCAAQTQRSLEHFSIGQDLIPREMITLRVSVQKLGTRLYHNENESFQLAGRDVSAIPKSTTVGVDVRKAKGAEFDDPRYAAVRIMSLLSACSCRRIW